MTRQQLDNSIDTSITNVNTVNGISPAADGANRKLMMNYVDERLTLSYAIRITQGGTGHPYADPVIFDNFQINPTDNTAVVYRNVSFFRTAIGINKIRISCKQATTPTNMDKISIIFGDRVAVLQPGYTDGGIPGAVTFREWIFYSGVDGSALPGDDALNGNFLTITLYP